MLQLASNREPSEYSRTNIFPKFGEGGWFLQSLNPAISETIEDRKKKEDRVDVKF